MKTKLIQTKDYLLLIDEEAKIKGSPFLCYNPLKITWDDDVVLYQGAMPEYNYKGLQKIIAYYPLTKEAKELDLPWLPNPFEEIDVEKLAKEHGNLYINQREKELGYLSFCEGYKAAQSKQFSLEDILWAFRMGRKKEVIGDRILNITCETTEEEFLQNPRLSTQQLPKEFIPEFIDNGEEDWIGDDINGEPFWNEKLELKTTTNSEGKQELVGTYC